MDNLINETNERIQQIIDNLETIKTEYEGKIEKAEKQFDIEVAKSKQYKEDFFTAKAKIDKMNKDIAGFEEDYKNLVDKFKDDELANILIAANKEISAKVDERKRKILKDRAAMNDVVRKAENVKSKMVRLTAEKKALESCLAKILDSYNYYTNALMPIIKFANDHRDNLCQSYSSPIPEENPIEENPIIADNTPLSDISIDESLLDESILDDSILLDYREISEALKESEDEGAKKEARKKRKDSDKVALVVEKSRSSKKVEEPTEEKTKEPIEDKTEENTNDSIIIEDFHEASDTSDKTILEDDTTNDSINDTSKQVEIENNNEPFNFDIDVNLESIINSDDSLE